MRIVILGYIVRCPLGAMVWHHSQFAMGLQQLGHDVLFLEDSGDEPLGCYDPLHNEMVDFPDYGLRWSHEFFAANGVGDRWAYFDARSDSWHGPSADRAVGFAGDADLVLNLSGVNPLRGWFDRVPMRVLVDTDPGFTQISHLRNPARRQFAAEHDRYFTWGLNIGHTDEVPDDGFDWVPIRQPVVMDRWPVSAPPAAAPYTTVMAWNSYAPVEWDGVHYGMKSESMAPFMDIPSRLDVPMELALGGGNEMRSRLTDGGWRLVDSLDKTRDARTFTDYIESSRGEFTVAKQGYVASKCGWFSDKSACYLASGRPVITQDTGFSDHLPTGAGLLAFDDPDGAVAAIEAVEADYPRHAAAARELAAEEFEAGRVLGEMLDGLS